MSDVIRIIEPARPTVQIVDQAQPIVQITEAEAEAVTIVETVAPVVTLVLQGPRGPQGVPGPSGAAAASYRHVQSVPASVWIIPHELGMYPNVAIIDSAGDGVIGAVHYDNENQITMIFSAAFSGEAYLS